MRGTAENTSSGVQTRHGPRGPLDTTTRLKSLDHRTTFA